jgi:hypothetical protein
MLIGRVGPMLVMLSVEVAMDAEVVFGVVTGAGTHMSQH